MAAPRRIADNMVEYDGDGVNFTIPEEAGDFEIVLPANLFTPANEITNFVPTDSTVEQALSVNESPQNTPTTSTKAMSDVELLAPTPRITTARPRSRRAQTAAVVTSSPFKAALQAKFESSARKGCKKLPDNSSAKEVETSKLQHQPKKPKKVLQKAKAQPNKKKKTGEHSEQDNTPCSICSKRYNDEPFLAFIQCSKCSAWYCEPCGPADIDMCYNCLP